MGTSSSQHLTIVQMNDTHAYFDLHPEIFWQGHHSEYRLMGGYARIATIVHQIRHECQGQVLFCDNGDTLHGTYVAVQTQGQALIPILNALGLQAMTAHWEFAYGPLTFKQRTTELSYPVLASNVYEQATGQHFFRPYIIQEIGNLRIGIIGIACNIVDKTMPPSFSKGLTFTLGRDELPSLDYS